MAKKYLDDTGLAYFWSKIKSYVGNYLPLSGGTLTGPTTLSDTVVDGDQYVNGVQYLQENSSFSGAYSEIYVDIDDRDVTSGTTAQDILEDVLPAICQQYPNATLTKFIGKAHPNSFAWYEIIIYDTSVVDSNGMPQYAFGFWRQWASGHDLNFNILVNNHTLSVAPMNQFPIGSVYTTATNENPNTLLGYGEWSLIDKRFAPATGQTGVTWNSSNTQATYNVDWTRFDHRIHMRLQFSNKVAFNDNNQIICTINGNTLGLSGGYQSYPYGYSDGLNAILMNTISWSGATATITKNDVSSSAGTRSTSTGQQCLIEFDFMFAMSSMLDSACNQFTWRRTA